jgi:outer membrane receptor protein involved in Fe transport
LVEDIIDERPVGDGVLQQDNMGSGILAGGELEVAFRTGSGVSGRAGYAYLFARKLEAGIDGRKELSGRSPHQLFLEGAYEFWRFASVRTGLRVLSPTPVRDPDTGAMITSEPVVDWRARVAIGPVFGLTAYVEITNLLDRVNELVPGFPGPGRTFWVGVRAVKR